MDLCRLSAHVDLHVSVEDSEETFTGQGMPPAVAFQTLQSLHGWS